VRDHIQRTEILVDGLREVLTSVFEISSLLEQQRQGVITRQLAAWAAILAVPTAVAGIYGMNFEHMPELKWEYGYYGVLVGIAVICGLLYRRFKKAGWLKTPETSTISRCRAASMPSRCSWASRLLSLSSKARVGRSSGVWNWIRTRVPSVVPG
jgi:hypothetical protein